MRIHQLLEQEFLQKLRQDVRNALVTLKVNGQNKVKTNQVLDVFQKHNNPISYEELVSLIGDDPIIRSINRYEIEFSNSSDDIEKSSKEKVEDEKLQVQNLAKKALDKRF